jgi:ribosomal protein S16
MGRYAQKVGYWVPHMKFWHQRRIAINRHALRYWIRVGAEPTPRVNWLMWNAGMMPKPWIPYGTQTMYDREDRSVKFDGRIMDYKGFYPKKADYYKKIRHTEEENLMMRKFKAEMHVANDMYPQIDPLYDFSEMDVGGTLCSLKPRNQK